MNVKEINPESLVTLPRYVGVAIGMTVATIWIIIAFQSQYLLPENYTLFMRLGWPILLTLKWLRWNKSDIDDDPGRHGNSNRHGEQDIDAGHAHGHTHGNDKLPTFSDDVRRLRELR